MKNELAETLHQAAELHHQVYKIVDGNDPDWASWYADWLISLSILPKLLKVRPVRSELVYLLVKLDKDYGREKPDSPWEQYYAKGIINHFSRRQDA